MKSLTDIYLINLQIKVPRTALEVGKLNAAAQTEHRTQSKTLQCRVLEKTVPIISSLTIVCDIMAYKYILHGAV